MKVAVVGSGTAGLAATWLLNEHSEHSVHLFESDSRPGGHANTVDFTKPGSPKNAPSTRVDTGFIVLNTVTYPNFLRFLNLLHIPIIASEMSFSVSRDRGLYEWAGTSLSALFAQRRNLVNPGQWRMVFDILRFNAAAVPFLREGDSKESIGAYLRRQRYSDAFRDNYLLPMTAAIWSTPPDQAALDFPALTLLRFMHNHHLLQILDRPSWLTIAGGSHGYVDAILAKLPKEQYHLGAGIESVRNEGGKVVLVREGGEEERFDKVIFACHADTALEILERGGGVTREEREVLGGFTFGENRAVLHADVELMPKRRSTWSAWNYLTASDGTRANVGSVSLTYWMNLLQSIPLSAHGPVLVTLNPPFEPKPELVVGEWSYMHPLFTEKSVHSQTLLPTIQNQRGISFCGAWTKYGFHEDGFASGLRAAASLGATPPFPITHAERSLPSSPLLENLMRVAESLRKRLEGVWGWAMWGLVLACLVVEIGCAVGERARRGLCGWKEGEVGGLIRVGRGVREVRGMWEVSMGKKRRGKVE